MAITQNLKNTILNNLTGSQITIRQGALLINKSTHKVLDDRIICLMLEYNESDSQCLVYWSNHTWKVNADAIVPEPYKKG